MELLNFLIIGQGISAGIGADQAARQRRWARKNMRHQIRWRYEDMKAAGINPILAAGGGGGGGLPSGAAATGPPGDSGSLVGDVTSAYGSVKKGLLDAQKLLESKQATKKLATAATLDMAQATSAKASAKLTDAQAFLTQAQKPRARLMGALDESILAPILNRIQSWMGTGKKAKQTDDEMGIEASNRRSRRKHNKSGKVIID